MARVTVGIAAVLLLASASTQSFFVASMASIHHRASVKAGSTSRSSKIACGCARSAQFTSTTPLSNVFGSACLAASLLLQPVLPAAAYSAEMASPLTPTEFSSRAVKIDVDLPALTRAIVAKKNRQVLGDSVKGIADAVQPVASVLSPSLKVQVPDDLKGALRDILSGDASVLLNGEEVGIEIETRKGEVNVKIASPSIPKLPLLPLNRALSAPMQALLDDFDPPSKSALSKDKVEAASEKEVVKEIEKNNLAGFWEAFKGEQKEKEVAVDFWGTEFQYDNGYGLKLGPFYGLTNLEVALGGMTSIIVGAYGSSYAYYKKSMEEAEAKAEEKRKALQNKKAAAASAAKKKVKKPTVTKKETAEKDVVNNKATKKALVVPKKGAEISTSVPNAEEKKPTAEVKSVGVSGARWFQK